MCTSESQLIRNFLVLFSFTPHARPSFFVHFLRIATHLLCQDHQKIFCVLILISFLIFFSFFFLISIGRIHSAMVSKINYDARSVTVEWYERNETKGKEIELDTILQLNAELAQQEELAASMPKIIKQTSSNALTRVSIFVCFLLFSIGFVLNFSLRFNSINLVFTFVLILHIDR